MLSPTYQLSLTSTRGPTRDFERSESTIYQRRPTNARGLTSSDLNHSEMRTNSALTPTHERTRIDIPTRARRASCKTANRPSSLSNVLGPHTKTQLRTQQ